jgi:putative flippase GtrA
VLTPSEKRFIKSWEEQRQGGRVKYYLLYIIMGSIVCMLVMSFLYAVLGLGLGENLLKIIIGSIIIVTITTVCSWWYNEKRFKSIIQREIREGIKKDESTGNGQ